MIYIYIYIYICVCVCVCVCVYIYIYICIYLHSLELAAGGIGLHVKTHKTEYTSFTQRGDISKTKLWFSETCGQVHIARNLRLIYRNDINKWLAEVWTATDRLSVIWKLDLSDKIKRNFFQATVVSMLLYGCTTWALEKNLAGENATNYIEQILEATSHKVAAVRPLSTYLRNYPNKMNKTCRALLEK